MDFRYSLVGFIVGALIGVSGMGGGSVMTPLLVLWFHVHPSLAVGTDLLYASVTKIAGAWQHIRQKTVNLRVVRMLCMGSAPGAMAGSLVLPLVAHHVGMVAANAWLSDMLAVVYMGLIVLWVAQWRGQRTGTERIGNDFPARRIILLGFVAGFVVGLTSIGSGALYMAVLSLLLPMGRPSWLERM